jgi:hypothetical protein
MPDDDDEFDVRLTALARVTVRDIAHDLNVRLTPSQRRALIATLERAFMRWMDNCDEMWSHDEDDAPHTLMDDPPAGSA